MHAKMKTTILAACLAATLGAPEARAVCSNTTETAEQTLWNVHNCWTAFRDWFRPYYNFQSSHWDEGWGWDSCDPTLALPKMWNSAYLITYGLRDSTQGPWHSDVDYYRWAAGGQHDFRYEPEDSTDAFAAAFGGFWQTNRVEMMCPSFNSRTAGVRAGTMLHEATHLIYWQWSHQSNPPGSNCTENCSDDWFFHALGQYPYGSLAGHKHSMNQIQIEYLCDLGEFSEWWVPAAITNAATTESNSRMTNRIRNPPGWTCGQPRPIYVPPPPPACPSGQRCCGAIVGGECLGDCWPIGNPCP
jgi:hypothetical protein